ncbi:MAG: hypothetical protein AAFY28_11470 [Actinomycetota bacterium]
MRTPTRSLLITATAGALILAACGSDDDSSDDTTATTEAAATTDAPSDDTTATTDGDNMADDDMADGDDSGDGGDGGSSSGDFTPGDIEFRAVNQLDRPVDLYLRTTGLVEASLVQSGLQPGEVSDLYAPPTDGVFLVTEEGATDPTCVVDCTDFIGEFSTAFEENGPIRTIVLYDDDFAGEARGLELWEDPTTDAPDASNSMPAGDDSAATLVVVSVSVTDNDFGMRLGFDGVAGCQDNTNLENVLIGGNQTPAFFFDGAADVVFYDNQDTECAEPTVGGPFAVEGATGSRTLLILSGMPGDLEGLVLPFVGSDSGEATPGAGGGSSDEGDADAGGATGIDDLVDEFAVELEANVGITGDDAQCVSEAFVGGLGEDELRDPDTGSLRDLDNVPVESQGLYEEVLLDSILLCDVDPSAIGG